MAVESHITEKGGKAMRHISPGSEPKKEVPCKQQEEEILRRMVAED